MIDVIISIYEPFSLFVIDPTLQTSSLVISISDKISLFNGGGPGKWRGMSDSSVIIKPHVPSVIGSSE